MPETFSRWRWKSQDLAEMFEQRLVRRATKKAQRGGASIGAGFDEVMNNRQCRERLWIQTAHLMLM